MFSSQSSVPISAVSKMVCNRTSGLHDVQTIILQQDCSPTSIIKEFLQDSPPAPSEVTAEASEVQAQDSSSLAGTAVARCPPSETETEVLKLEICSAAAPADGRRAGRDSLDASLETPRLCCDASSDSICAHAATLTHSHTLTCIFTDSQPLPTPSCPCALNLIHILATSLSPSCLPFSLLLCLPPDDLRKRQHAERSARASREQVVHRASDRHRPSRRAPEERRRWQPAWLPTTVPFSFARCLGKLRLRLWRLGVRRVCGRRAAVF